MLDFLIKKYIPNYQETRRASVRNAYGNLAGVIGIIVNIILSAVKLTIGYFAGSMAVISDGIHNLVDGLSAVVAIVTFRISGKEPDLTHPYGYGRIEYIASLGMGVVVIVIGIQFLIEAVERINNAVQVDISLLLIGVLAISSLGTLILCWVYKKIANIIKSKVLEAAGAECFADIISSLVIVVGLVIGKLTGFQIDGYLTLLVAGLIIHTGYEIIKDSTSTLLGQEPNMEDVNRIKEITKSFPEILGMHDLIIHNYGVGNSLASMHVEVDANNSIIDSHDVIDAIEKQVNKELGIQLTIHMDPIVLNEETLNTAYWLTKMIKAYNKRYAIQELRSEIRDDKKIMSFELVIPFDEKRSEREIRQDIHDLIEVKDEKCEAKITIKKAYTII